jgi:hypothetical protein
LLGLALRNAARATGLDDTEHACPPSRCPTPLERLLFQATNFVEGRLSVPESMVTINSGKLRAKDECEFLGFGKQE